MHVENRGFIINMIISCHVASQERPAFCSLLDLFPSSPLQLHSDTFATQEAREKGRNNDPKWKEVRAKAKANKGKLSKA